jgi:hypothetical protein
VNTEERILPVCNNTKFTLKNKFPAKFLPLAFLLLHDSGG